MRSTIECGTEGEIRRYIVTDGPLSRRDDTLGLVREGDYSAFFAPVDWINEETNAGIVCVTLGKQQALEALLTSRKINAMTVRLSGTQHLHAVRGLRQILRPREVVCQECGCGPNTAGH